MEDMQDAVDSKNVKNSNPLILLAVVVIILMILLMLVLRFRDGQLDTGTNNRNNVNDRVQSVETSQVTETIDDITTRQQISLEEQLVYFQKQNTIHGNTIDFYLNRQGDNRIETPLDSRWSLIDNDIQFTGGMRLNSNFNVLDIRRYGITINNNNDIFVKSVLIGSIDGEQGLFQIFVQTNIADAVPVGAVIRIEYVREVVGQIKIIRNISFI